MTSFNRGTAVKTAALLMFLVGISAAGVKYVAVVETEVDAQSGASAALNPAEVRQITAALRREAVNNLPRDKYNILTSETVQANGAVLEACADENCVVSLGRTIGADYIVRGIISKFQKNFTLTVEIYETEDGTLAASSEPVMSENLGELLSKAMAASSKMYRKFAGVPDDAAGWTQTRESQRGPQYTQGTGGETQTPAYSGGYRTAVAKKGGIDFYVAPNYVLTPDVLTGANAEGGLVWDNGRFFGIDFGAGNDEGGSSFSFWLGGGLTLGGVYDFGNQLQLVYGGTAGCWWMRGKVKSNPNDINASGRVESLNFGGPFVKLRWNYIELTYRGLLGRKWGGGVEKGSIFSYNVHQLMLGLYFSTSNRDK